MNTDRLLDVYEQISEAPDAIARLRRFMLNLAVRGKLVEQNAADVPAAELLKRIAADRDRLIELGEIKKSKTLPDVSKDEEQFPPPLGWSWSRLGDVTFIAQGFAFKSGDYSSSADDGLPLIKIGDIGSNSPEVFIKGSYDKKYLVQPGQLLLGLSGSIKCSVWNGPTALLNQRIARILPASSAVTDGWLFLVVENSLEKWKSETSKLTVQNIKAKQLSEAPVPLPPLAEQHRIVAKVDELMALCDQLEEAHKTREEVRDKLTSASLARLTAPDANPEELPTHAAFALEALPALTSRPDQIKTIRQTILNLAVRGKLVEQDPADEPASELLERLEQERKALVKSRKIRGSAPPKSPLAGDEGFDLPSSWQLCALGQITLITDPNPSHRYPDYTGGTVPILSTREFYGKGSWNPETAKLTTEEFWKYQKGICDFASGDIMFARKGRLGLPRFLPSIDRFTFSHTLFSIKPMSGLVPEYLLWLLRRDEVVGWLTNEMNQNTGVPTLGKAKTERLPTPLPPLVEQNRIVAKVDALMTLCDRLEKALTTADTTRTRLLEALLHEALEPVQDRDAAAA